MCCRWRGIDLGRFGIAGVGRLENIAACVEVPAKSRVEPERIDRDYASRSREILQGATDRFPCAHFIGLEKTNCVLSGQ